MLRVPGSALSMEIAFHRQLLNSKADSFNCDNITRKRSSSPFVQASSADIADSFSSIHLKLLNLMNRRGDSVKVFAVRRRRIHEKTGTYVLLEPGEDEKFVSEEELRATLKGYLESWPGPTLPLDLAKFETLDDAASFLVSSVCELEIDGDVGSVQWYEVRLE
ncbi:hypothetical protein OIU77_021388 [Salix suchowensis]|uniref:Chlororespiratory reduction 7 n=1 Tax=Salix suchowensis TaxID=1278906 RepID=A0ABQ9CCM8_9ROSI|nr:protein CHLORORESPIRATORY REDUCTION [Salix suchowensis]KAJ6396345.1 hypothetical protein OIU77_021388 [Salix suchowensis]